MKRIFYLFAFLVAAVSGYSQSSYFIRGDSVFVEKVGGNGELILKNAGRDTQKGGVLYNKGGGRTAFKRSLALNDSTFVVGGDTIVIKGGVKAGSALDTTSLSWRIYERVKYSDTLLMLYPYLRKNDTASLSARIDARVKYSDTASMLSIYLRKADTLSLSNRIDLRMKYSDSVSLSNRIDSKQQAGNYITGLNGDGAATGPGLANFVLSPTSIAPGTYKLATVTFDQKGRGTFAANGVVAQISDSSFMINNDTIRIKGTGQTLQQVLDKGSALTKHDTIYQGRNILATNGQFINKDTNRVGENQSILIFGTSVDQGLVPPFNFLATRWGSQVAGNLGLREWNRAISGTTLMHHASADSCMFDRLYTIPNWDPSIRYIVIGTYPLNDVIYQDSSTYRTGLSAMIDSLHLNRGYPLQSIIVLNGSPAPVRSSTLGLIATASIHVAQEKGTRYFDSYNYLLGESANVYSDNLHLSLKGHINLSTGLLNATTTFDSVAYIMTNALQVQKGLTNNGFFMNRGSDSTLGRLYVGGNFNLIGNFEKFGNFLSGINAVGDNTNRSLNLRFEPVFNQRLGIRSSGSATLHTDIYTSWGSANDSVRLGYLQNDGTTFVTLFGTSSAGTSVWTPLTVTGPSTFNNTSNFSRIGTVTGNTTAGSEWNLYNDNTFKTKNGIKLTGSSNPFFTDVYTNWGNGANGVRLGWMGNDGTTFTPVLTALKSGTITIPGLASGGTAPTTSGTTKMVITDANGLLSFANIPAGSSYTFSNGLTESGGIAKLGGALTENTSISSANATYKINITGVNTSQPGMLNVSTSGNGGVAITGTATTGHGLHGVATGTNGRAIMASAFDGTGVFSSATGVAFHGESTSGKGLEIITTYGATNSISSVNSYSIQSAGTAANGIGGANEFLAEMSNGSNDTAARITWEWSNATAGSQTGALKLWTKNNAGSVANRFQIDGDGKLTASGYGSGAITVVPATTPVYSSGGVIGERIAPKIYTALLTQSGTGAPTAAVLGTNEIGSIVWTRNSTGSYTGTLTGAFTANKTWLIVQKGDGNGSFVNALLSSTSANTVSLDVRDNAGSVTDNFTNMSIEIRVYP